MPEPNLANDAWEALLTAHAAVMKQLAAENTWTDVSMREYDVLYTLSKCDSAQRISDLGDHVLLSQPALSRLVDRLVDRGLLSRCADPADARAVRVSLTDQGRDVQRSIGRTHARDVQAAMGALTEDELITLAAVTAKLANSAPVRSQS